jgi:hypothetical protein
MMYTLGADEDEAKIYRLDPVPAAVAKAEVGYYDIPLRKADAVA